MSTCELENSDLSAAPASEEAEAGIESSPATARVPRSRRHYRWLWLAVLPVAACLVLAVGVFYRGGEVAAAPMRIEPLSFGFQADSREDYLLLTWSPASKVVRGATSAKLSIQDGPESEDVPLDMSTMRRGGIRYYPVFQDVSFRLTLADPTGRTASETAHPSPHQ
jgi:hypothetical protein